ncbi:MAG: hypothetical protein ACR2NR_19605 [Solirubrobacteraceae bacterium]
MSESSRHNEQAAAGPQDYAGGAAQGRALMDRMDRLPGWPLSRFALVVLGLAYFFVFYDITDIGFGRLSRHRCGQSESRVVVLSGAFRISGISRRLRAGC